MTAKATTKRFAPRAPGQPGGEKDYGRMAQNTLERIRAVDEEWSRILVEYLEHHVRALELWERFKGRAAELSRQRTARRARSRRAGGRK